jgi:putative aldouronate transport system substrate-binding protein
MKKSFALILTALMLLSLSVIAEEPATLTILIPQDALVSDYKDNLYTQWIEESMNVNLDFIILPQGESLDKLSVMVASGEDLGDVVVCVLDQATQLAFADAGAIIPLNEFYEKYDTNVETYDEETGKSILKLATNVDGNIYGIPNYLQSASDEMRYRIWINTVWLERLGLEMPTTTEEFYNVLKAFKEQDANGNGDPTDEIPMLGNTAGWSTDQRMFLTNAFVYEDGGYGYLLDAEGNVSFNYTTDAYKEALSYMNKLVSEGLLSTDSFTLTYPQYQEVLNRQPSVVGVFCFTNPIAQAQDHPENRDYQFVPPLVGPEGVQGITYIPTQPSNCWFITSSCKNPDLAFLVGDFLYSEEAYLRNRVGVEGIHWEKADAAAYEYMGYSEDMLLWNDYNSQWSNLSNVNWHLAGPALCRQPNYMTMWKGDESYYNYRRWVGLQYYMEIMPKEGEYVPALNFTPEETEELAEIRTAIETYRSECRTRFILNDMSLENDWDGYLSELDAIGMVRYTEICQAAYNRFLGK